MRSDKNVLVSALYDALAVLGEYARSELLTILTQQYGIMLSENECSSKQEIEDALTQALGLGGTVLIKLWNEKLEVIGGLPSKTIDENQA